MNENMIDTIPEISMEGFQVVGREMFSNTSRGNEPICTLWPEAIGFNKAAIMALNCCERILIEVNVKTKCILAVPVTESDKDSVKWIKSVNAPVSRKIECRKLTSQLYSAWEMESKYGYHSVGKIVSADSKVMLLFEFSHPDFWTIGEK